MLLLQELLLHFMSEGKVSSPFAPENIDQLPLTIQCISRAALRESVVEYNKGHIPKNILFMFAALGAVM